jgi:hypothetical protein
LFKYTQMKTAPRYKGLTENSCRDLATLHIRSSCCICGNLILYGRRIILDHRRKGELSSLENVTGTVQFCYESRRSYLREILPGTASREIIYAIGNIL